MPARTQRKDIGVVYRCEPPIKSSLSSPKQAKELVLNNHTTRRLNFHLKAFLSQQEANACLSGSSPCPISIEFWLAKAGFNLDHKGFSAELRAFEMGGSALISVISKSEADLDNWQFDLADDHQRNLKLINSHEHTELSAAIHHGTPEFWPRWMVVRRVPTKRGRTLLKALLKLRSG